MCGLSSEPGPEHLSDPSRARPGRSELPALVARITRDEPMDTRARAGLIGRLAALLARSLGPAGAGAFASGRWLVDVVLEVAPAVPVRNAATLRDQHPGRSEPEIAATLVSAASKATAAVGAAGGALAAVEFAAPPMLLGAPVQLAAETVAVVAIELKLVAELHEIFGQAQPGTPTERAMAYAAAWAARRGVDPLAPGGLSGILGGAARRQLRSRLLRRAGRNAATLAPFLAGAVAGAELNRRDTRMLGEKLIADLHSRRTGGWYKP